MMSFPGDLSAQLNPARLSETRRIHNQRRRNKMKMKLRDWSRLGRFSLLSGLLLGIAVSPAPAQGASEDASGKLEGTWSNEVTVRDCGTGAALFSFPALVTFNSGGTMIDTTTGTSPSLRSPGLGKWERTGNRTYSVTVFALLFTPAGTWSGTQRLDISIFVTGNDNTFNTSSTTFDTGGIRAGAACATGVGHRL
jgi:hypothetical protein